MGKYTVCRMGKYTVCRMGKIYRLQNGEIYCLQNGENIPFAEWGNILFAEWGKYTVCRMGKYTVCRMGENTPFAGVYVGIFLPEHLWGWGMAVKWLKCCTVVCLLRSRVVDGLSAACPMCVRYPLTWPSSDPSRLSVSWQSARSARAH